jgi:4-amino-4-deoxy-L-arabinose transferase-like glycosyltransferase
MARCVRRRLTGLNPQVTLGITMARSSPRTLKAKLAAHDWEYTVAVALVALLPRLFVAIAWAKEPVWDGHYYHFGAERIAEGFGYSDDVVIDGNTVTKPWVHYPVGYSGFLGLLYRVLGSGLWVAPVANALVGAGLVLVVHRLARAFLNERRARIAAVLVALHPGLIAYSSLVMTEVLASLLIVGAFWAALAQRGVRAALLSGFILGLAALVRPSALLCLPILLIAWRGNWGTMLKHGAIAAGLCFATIVPWTVRNCVVMDGCALVSTNGGWNLAIGALTEDGRFRTLRANDGCPVVTGQVQQDRCWADVGRRLIFEDPVGWLQKIPKKLAQTYNHESFAIEYLHQADPASWPEQRRAAGRQLLTLFHRLLLIGAALCMVAMTGYRPRAGAPYLTQTGLLLGIAGLSAYCLADDANQPFYLLALVPPLVAWLPLPGAPGLRSAGHMMVAWLLATSITHSIFFGDDRYHLVVAPALCILAAAALRAPSQVPSEAAVPQSAQPKLA